MQILGYLAAKGYRGARDQNEVRDRERAAQPCVPSPFFDTAEYLQLVHDCGYARLLREFGAPLGTDVEARAFDISVGRRKGQPFLLECREDRDSRDAIGFCARVMIELIHPTPFRRP
jgi:hypothetical protein